ncbi:hypothetical protein LG3211_3070 [Lysobacter gummosus]|nr:hypothetical protein LG3211_3070 [Lysobacter gummosus]
MRWIATSPAQDARSDAGRAQARRETRPAAPPTQACRAQVRARSPNRRGANTGTPVAGIAATGKWGRPSRPSRSPGAFGPPVFYSKAHRRRVRSPPAFRRAAPGERFKSI